MLNRLLWVLVGFCWASSSYSEESISPYYGQTRNAAQGGLNWSMDSVFPAPPGLSVNGVLYSYTIRKQLEDSVSVHVQNEDALGTGYVFRETDDWLPGSQDGTQIRKLIGVGSIHRDRWGDGSIQVEGNGSVEDPNVLYTYTVDPCYDPQFSPQCPGYKVIIPDIETVDYDIYDATQDAYTEQYNPDDELYDDDENSETDEEREEREAEEEKDREERLEKALAEADNSAMFAAALAQSQILATIDARTNMNSYYARKIDGGVYNDAIQIQVTELPDNRQGLRNGLAQQLLHQQMVQSQYEK